jgi:hypothetical protein
VAGNGFFGAVPTFVTSNISGVSYLSLAYNFFTGKSLGRNENTRLTELYVSFNELSGPLPALLTSNPSEYIVNENFFTGKMSASFRSFPVNSEKLIWYQVGSNYLTGTVVSKFTTLPGMLNISYNLLTGSLNNLISFENYSTNNPSNELAVNNNFSLAQSPLIGPHSLPHSILWM